MELDQILAGNNLTFLVNLALCAFAGLAIGYEREARHKDAGISTHAMVITGAMLFTFLSPLLDDVSPTRIASQIIPGIGFLGAGLIIKEGTNVKNLTTASSIWYAAAIGMAFGFGFYFIGIVATIAAVIFPRIPHISEK